MADHKAEFSTYVNYYPKLAEGEEYPIQYIATAGFQRQKFDRQLVTVKDLRTCEEDFNLDVQGFQLVPSLIDPEVWQDQEAITRQLYYPHVCEMLIKATGATYIHPFPPHVIRRDPAQAVFDLPGPKELPDDARHGLSPPALFVHVDQSYRGAETVMNRLSEIDVLLPKTKHRWGIINVWQPLQVVHRDPLAACDARSVQGSDLREVTTRIVFGPKNVDNQQWHIVAKPEHKWYYASDMTPREALLIKIFDTKEDGRARRVPHTAIQTPNDYGPPRESIEIRCLVFWEDQERE